MALFDPTKSLDITRLEQMQRDMRNYSVADRAMMLGGATGTPPADWRKGVSDLEIAAAEALDRRIKEMTLQRDNIKRKGALELERRATLEVLEKINRQMHELSNKSEGDYFEK